MTGTIFVLNGPNLNLLATARRASTEPRRSPRSTRTSGGARALKLNLDIRQSNHEGELVDWLHEALAKASAVIINAGGYAHTSIAIRDAVAALPIPVIEVHLSHVYAREHFRRQSMIAQGARGSIVGLGAIGYVLALDAAAHLCKGAPAKGASQIQ